MNSGFEKFKFHMDFLFLAIFRIYILKNISCTKQSSFLGGLNAFT
jgi:hypothetical protein